MYLNIFYEKGYDGEKSYIHIWDDKKGYSKIPYQKYAYKEDINGNYKTLYGQPCKLVRRWSKSDFEKGIIFESDIFPEMRYLVDNYLDSETPSDAHVVLNFDIEVSTDGGLPDVFKAENEITSIAYFDSITMEYTVHILDKDMKLRDSDLEQRGHIVHIRTHTTEMELLNAFLTDYQSIQPTILIGWNTDHFDIPYLYNRIVNVFDVETADQLSPIRIVQYDKYKMGYKIAGVSSLDMLKMYKNFTFNEKISYSLDAISKDELGEGKIEYDGTLDKLFEEDIEKFIEYNVHDVRLVQMIDDKMKLVDLTKNICHKGHVPFEDVYFSSRFLDGAILTYLKRKGNIVVPNKPKKDNDLDLTTVKFSGAFVKDPVLGKHDWIVDLDVTSMYPSIIMSLNISPETLVGKVLNWDNSKFVKNEDIIYEVEISSSDILRFNSNELSEFLKNENFGISSNGILYDLNKKGIIPEILEVWFDERTKMKKLVKKYGIEVNSDGTINDEYDKDKMEYYNNLQKTQKILLNSLYGVLGLPTFRFYNLENAEAVTTTGVDLIKFAETITNHYYKTTLGDKYKITYDDDSVEYKFKSQLTKEEIKYIKGI